MKWVVAINQTSIENTGEQWDALIRSAVRSARRNTTLEPFIIYDGEDGAFTRELHRDGVTVLRHRVSIYNFLRDYQQTHYPKNPHYLQTAAGAFLRMDVPLLFPDDKFVLYTDCDVMFLREPPLQACMPRYFACAPERLRGSYENMNSGVMLMNIQTLKQDHVKFRGFIEERYSEIRTTTGIDFDQGAYKQFYAGRYDLLADELNWKPYWGRNNEASIVHFHGPKPHLVRRLEQLPDYRVPDAAVDDLYRLDPGSYCYYVGLWEAFQGGPRPGDGDDAAIDGEAFDERWYLATYRDIREAVAAGSMASGLQHYREHGRAEGREPRAPQPWPYRADPPQRYHGNFRRYTVRGGMMRPFEDVAGFLRDQPDNRGDMGRFFAFCLLFDQIAREGISGDLAELGVWKGNTASLMVTAARRMGKLTYLLDTFEGFAVDDLQGIDAHQRRQFTDTSLEAVRAALGEDGVRYITGRFPDSAAQLPEDASFCLVHIDCDLHQPLADALAYFYPRLVAGGVLVVHDYASLHWDGVTQAVDEFFADKSECVVPLPDCAGSVVVRKSKTVTATATPAAEANVSDVPFDEDGYRTLYADVARGIARGDLLSGKQHYLDYGRAEGRRPYLFDPDWYSQAHPTAAQDVAAGLAASLQAHYETIGRQQGYAPRRRTETSELATMLASVDGPLVPAVVTHIPRSGSTLLMALLAQHPQIVVAPHYPYEVRVATYFAHAAHVMTSQGDYVKSGSPPDFMRQLFSLSFNPFNTEEFEDVITDRRMFRSFFDLHVRERTVAACRDMATDFYRLLAVDQRKLGARHFAEKCELNHRFRAILRQTYPALKEIILVRDLRDLYCSYLRYFSGTAEESLPNVANSGRMLLAVKNTDDPNLLFIRYEDCVRNTQATMVKVFRFLQVDGAAPSARTETVSELFQRHATSETPEASIGRWRNDLSGPQRHAFYESLDYFARFASTFGYAPE